MLNALDLQIFTLLYLILGFPFVGTIFANARTMPGGVSKFPERDRFYLKVFGVCWVYLKGFLTPGV